MKTRSRNEIKLTKNDLRFEDKIALQRMNFIRIGKASHAMSVNDTDHTE